MKKLIAFLLISALICTGCLAEEEKNTPFMELNDPDLLPYMQDQVYQGVLDSLNSEEYFVENVSAIYISDEYLEELAFNSQSNLYFGYTLNELNQQFQGQRYVFTLNEVNETTVKTWEPYDNALETIIKNVAVGTGVILVCVTVSVVSAGVGAPAVAMIFAVAADTGITAAASGAGIGFLSGTIVEYIKTGDIDKALKAGTLTASEGYKWGAIGGTLTGGAGEAIALKGATLNGLTMNEAAMIQCDSNYPLGLIKEFHSMDEYLVYRDAGLIKSTVGNRPALIRNLDWNQVDSFGQTNLQRMASGKPPLDPEGIAYELHHVGQQNDSVLAILSQAEHRGEGNFRILHDNLLESVIDRGEFANVKTQFWKDYAELIYRWATT